MARGGLAGGAGLDGTRDPCQPTERGREVVEIAQSYVAEIEDWVNSVIGAGRLRTLREDLDKIRRASES